MDKDDENSISLWNQISPHFLEQLVILCPEITFKLKKISNRWNEFIPEPLFPLKSCPIGFHLQLGKNQTNNPCYLSPYIWEEGNPVSFYSRFDSNFNPHYSSDITIDNYIQCPSKWIRIVIDLNGIKAIKNIYIGNDKLYFNNKNYNDKDFPITLNSLVNSALNDRLSINNFEKLIRHYFQNQPKLVQNASILSKLWKKVNKKMPQVKEFIGNQCIISPIAQDLNSEDICKIRMKIKDNAHIYNHNDFYMLMGYISLIQDNLSNIALKNNLIQFRKTNHFAECAIAHYLSELGYSKYIFYIRKSKISSRDSISVRDFFVNINFFSPYQHWINLMPFNIKKILIHAYLKEMPYHNEHILDYYMKEQYLIMFKKSTF